MAESAAGKRADRQRPQAGGTDAEALRRTEAGAEAGGRPASGRRTIGQMMAASPRALAQRAIADKMNGAARNRTGLPDGVKAGAEALSGLSLDHVRVHRDSPAPARLGAHAFARGGEIHLAPGQERHLPHEAWHVIQQAQGRVRPTGTLGGGQAVNDDPGLEREADRMGARAERAAPAPEAALVRPAGGATLQGVFKHPVKAGKGKQDKEFKGGEVPTSLPHGIKKGDVERLSRSATDFGTLKTADEFTAAIARLGGGEGMVDVAGPAKEAAIQRYVDLIPHLGGEENGDVGTGGHLLTLMRKTWKSRLHVVEQQNDEGVWVCHWNLLKDPKKGASPANFTFTASKMSTMFPGTWTEDDLRQQLMGSVVEGSSVTLQPSGIQIKKAGDTFYPVLS